MAILEILTLPDPRLSKKARPVTEVDAIQPLIEDMLETMYHSPDGVGLASTQVGRLEAIIVIDYSETRNMTPISGGFANKAQNFEAVAQYQFDFGLRPSLGYVLSKGKDIEGGIGNEDLVNYIDVGMTYYFNKNMNTFVDYKINQLKSDNKLGINDDNIVAVGMTYQF